MKIHYLKLAIMSVCILMGCSNSDKEVEPFEKHKKNIEKSGVSLSKQVKIFAYGTSDNREMYNETWVLFSPDTIKPPGKGMPWNVQDTKQDIEEIMKREGNGRKIINPSKAFVYSWDIKQLEYGGTLIEAEKGNYLYLTVIGPSKP